MQEIEKRRWGGGGGLREKHTKLNILNSRNPNPSTSIPQKNHLLLVWNLLTWKFIANAIVHVMCGGKAQQNNTNDHEDGFFPLEFSDISIGGVNQY